MTFTRLHPGANTPFSDDIRTYTPENILMLLRQGPAVLSPRAYRRQLMRELASYGWFLAKQLLKPSRHRDPRFRDFHVDVIRRVRHEVPSVLPVGATLRLFSGLARLQGLGVRRAPPPGT